MKYFYKKIITIVLAFGIMMLISLFLSNPTYARESTSMTIVDAVGGAEIKFNPSNTNKSGSGWSWNKEATTLTLDGFNGEKIEANGDFTLKLKGVNTMTVSGNSAKGLVSDYSYGTISIEKTNHDANDILNINCTNVNDDKLISACKININGGTVSLNVNQTENGMGKAYGPYCNSGTYLYNDARLNITMNANDASNRLQGAASIHCCGSGSVNVTINGVRNSIGINNLYIEEESTSCVTINMTDTDSQGEITYAIESLNRIGPKGSLTVNRGRIMTGWNYSSYPDISSKILITPTNPSKNYILFPYLVNGYRAPTFLDATTLEPIEDGISFIPQAEEVPLTVVDTTALNLKANKVEESATTEFSSVSTSFIPSVLHGLNPAWSNRYATYEVVSGTLPPGVGVSSTYGHISGEHTEECEAGSFTVRVTRKSDNSTANVTINYGAVTEAEKYITIDAGTATEAKINITTDASGDGWTYTGSDNTLTLNNYTGGPIYSDKGVNIVLFGTNTIHVNKGDKGGIITNYFNSNGELTICAIGGSTKLTINVASDCDTIEDAIISANKLNIYSGAVNIIGHNCPCILHGIYCNAGAYVSNDEASLNIDISTSDGKYIQGVDSLYVNNFEGNINVSVEGGSAGSSINAISYLSVFNGNPNITLSAKTSAENCKNYATEDISFNTAQGKITVKEGIVSTSYNYSNLFNCTDKTKITTKNTEKNWVLLPRKNYLNNGCIFVDSITSDIIKDGLTIEAVSTRLPFKYHSSPAFNIIKSKVGEELKTSDGMSLICLRGGFEGINIYDEALKLEVIEGALPKGITLNPGGSLYGTFEEITQPGKVKIRATRQSDNSTQEFYLYFDKVIDEDPDLVFPDIAKGKWYTEAVKYVKDHGMMSGYTSGIYAGEFGPEDTISRAQIVTILYRLNGEPSVAGLENPFADVPEGKYYTNAIKWAVKKGITTGKTATSFDPNGPVTRQELAVFLARYADKILGKNINSTYAIAGIADYNNLSTWAIAPMQYIMEKGVITGDMALGYARILPKNNATRAAAATMITRFCQNIVEK